MTLQELAAAGLLFAGAFFFFAGAVGLLRFPDPCTRIHALTKADNLGLGFVVLGLTVEAPVDGPRLEARRHLVARPRLEQPVVAAHHGPCAGAPRRRAGADVSFVDWTLDGVLAVLLPLIAWGVVTAAALDEAIMLFIVLGFVAALAWARLDAIDVALVEAAVGSGLTGALLLSALPSIEPRPRRPSPLGRRAGIVVLLAGITVWLGATTLCLPARSEGLTESIRENIAQSGAEHPITAVLLDFRGYDTLIEVAVLLVAALAVHDIQRSRLPQRPRDEPTAELLASFSNLLVPVSIVLAGFLVWEGSHAPGGAFQAGTILAGCGVTLQLIGSRPALRMSLRVRAALVLGPALFIVLADAPLLRGRDLLDYPRSWAGPLIFALELALTLSIAVILVMFFPGAPSRPEPPTRARDAP